MPKLSNFSAAPAFARRFTVLAGLTACALPPCAQAQASDTPAALDAVIVTGTRAKDRTVLNTAVPVDVLTQDDLKRAAGPDGALASALQALLPSFNFPRQSNSGGADHVRAAQLRGMSPDQVLVLINGKRRHTTAIVNLESKIGKGTTPVDFNSIPVNAIKRIEVLRDGAGAQYGSDAIGGVINILLDDAPTGGELEATLGSYHTQFEPTDQTITDGQAAELRGKVGWQIGDGGFLRLGAEAQHHNPTNRAGFDNFAGSDSADDQRFANQRNYRPGEPEIEDYNLWFNGGCKLGNLLGGDAKAYTFGTFNHRHSEGSAFFRYPDGSDNVKSVYPNGFLPVTTGRNQDVSLVGGIKAGLGADWSGDASLTYGSNLFEYGLSNSINASIGAASPTSFHLGDFRFDQITANLDASRDLVFAGLPGPLTLALGAELRHEHYKTTPGDPASYVAGPIDTAPPGAVAEPGLQDIDAVSLSRNVYGAYAEVSGDLAPKFFADAALRVDHYDDFGSATTGKLSARYEFAPGFALRGALSNNFRAPSLAQTGFSFTVTEFGDGGALTQVRLLPVASALAQSLGAKPLKAEKSRNASLGLTAQPDPRLSLSVDAYLIDVDDRITLSDRQTVGAGPDSANFFTNALDTRTKGIDLVATWLAPLAGGDFKASWAASFNRTSIRNIHADALVGLEEQNTLTDAAPRNRHVFSANWSNAQWALLGRLTRQGSTTRVFDFGDGFTPTQTYDAKWQLDLEAEYKFTRQLSLALGGINVTDNYPTRSSADISYFGNLPYDVLSPIGFNGAYFYGRLRYTF